MAEYKVTWIDKPGGSNNPNTRIERVGGSYPKEWYASAQDVIRWILNEDYKFYVEQHGQHSWVEVGSRNNIPYLRTVSDQTPLDNLLSLTNVSTN